jgi:hypothetical protein
VDCYGGGIRRATDATFTAPWTAATTLQIGAESGSLTQCFDGWVHVRYWPRALSAAEHATLAKAGGLYLP